jgi:hypothetical protein
MSRRSLYRRCRDRENRGGRENQRERRPVSASLIGRGGERDPGYNDRNPGESAEPREQSTDVCEVCGCNEWQQDSGRALR